MFPRRNQPEHSLGSNLLEGRTPHDDKVPTCSKHCSGSLTPSTLTDKPQDILFPNYFATTTHNNISYWVWKIAYIGALVKGLCRAGKSSQILGGWRVNKWLRLATPPTTSQDLSFNLVTRTLHWIVRHSDRVKLALGIISFYYTNPTKATTS